MTNCLVKSVILYFIIMAMVTIIKPYPFYYDNKCTRPKKWNLYRETGNVNDLCNLYSCAIIVGLFCFILCRFI